jgi:UDP-N-acetylglucosamine acyltransferase
VARGVNSACGLNVIGLRRNGFSAAERLELKTMYHALFRNGQNLTAAAAEARKEFPSRSSQVMLDFIAASKRGVCADRGLARGEEDDQ